MYCNNFRIHTVPDQLTLVGLPFLFVVQLLVFRYHRVSYSRNNPMQCSGEIGIIFCRLTATICIVFLMRFKSIFSRLQYVLSGINFYIKFLSFLLVFYQNLSVFHVIFLTFSNAISFSDNFDIFFRKEKKLFLLTF